MFETFLQSLIAGVMIAAVVFVVLRMTRSRTKYRRRILPAGHALRIVRRLDIRNR
jgi:hypothetical protein